MARRHPAGNFKNPKSFKDFKAFKDAGDDIGSTEINPIFARPEEATAFSKSHMPQSESLPETAYQVVHDEVMLDGNARLNLATFVGTWMDERANRLYLESADKNMIDKDEYPKTAEIETHCWTMLADLWHAPDPGKAIGTSTVGSSEACMLGGLALKRRWQHERKAAGKPADRPNLVMSSAVQVCWEKFCNYFDVEPRYVPISREHKVFDGSDLARYVDENTIGVVAIMGVTYTGMYEPVKRIAAALDEIQRTTGLDIKIHVDAASGGMIAPFIQPELEWDFRIERVVSINTSGHKYGLVYPGLGWALWRSKEWLPSDLVFTVSYLGGDMPTFALNFSRPGTQVLLQYYMFLRLGFDGYRRVQQTLHDVATYVSAQIGKMDDFTLWNDGSDIPVFAWTLSERPERKWDLYDLQDRLRMKGWLVPAYPLPADLTDVTVQRIVVRDGFSHDLADAFLEDLRTAVNYLDGLKAPMPSESQHSGFHH
ncbi:glutamate decarboxylase [Bifidobacterium tibiigranuli]|jgi:glutamate decarboxylase|uniref:glutamate decarboxylase n=1 Tax=Bifidobacterium tibiigranuli TaxID=2172043 RepID=UPI0023527EA3|nr:glutamate decarboxylase [Bifidobacterium tibiigranuli]MCI1211963.1 glutamate decarboxylase [Bifidobacterium tibiigranuli]MCI1221715.1 glutamate decarboxylase [Bifidobacterium tibiigranuli]